MLRLIHSCKESSNSKRYDELIILTHNMLKQKTEEFKNIDKTAKELNERYERMKESNDRNEKFKAFADVASTSTAASYAEFLSETHTWGDEESDDNTKNKKKSKD